MTNVIIALTASYSLVVALIVYLLLYTRIHWVMKFLATAATVAAIPLTYWGVGELRGLPSDGAIPPSFRMLWAQMIEPNTLQEKRATCTCGYKPWIRSTIPWVRRAHSNFLIPKTL